LSYPVTACVAVEHNRHAHLIAQLGQIALKRGGRDLEELEHLGARAHPAAGQ
jgi:hypothetical protein